MKKYSLSGLIISVIFLGFFLTIQCGKDNPASSAKTSSGLDKEITGVWRFSLLYNQDTTFHIVLNYDSGYVYKISVDINNADTMERENGSWYIVSDTISRADTAWMVRGHCRQINLQTHALDSVDCGIDTAGIKLNISQSGSGTVWVIPLNDFVKYLPPNFMPPGLALPPGQFFKD